MNEDTSPVTSLLRLVAILGTLAVWLQQILFMPQLQPRQEAGFIVLLVAVLAVAASLSMLMPDATVKLLRYKDLLIPLGLFITLSAVFNYLVTLPVLAAMFTSSWPITILTFSFSLSVGLLFNFLLSIIYAGWTTSLIFQAVVLGRVNPVEVLALGGRWFWRTLGAELFGWVLTIGVTICALALSTASVSLALILIAVASLVLNLATVAVLPIAIADSRPLDQAIRHGLKVSRANMHKWAPLVIAQMLLLGWITFIHVSYTTRETTSDKQTHLNSALDLERADSVPEYTDTVTTSQTVHTQTNWGVNGFWIGGYADNCKWYGSLMEALKAKPIQWIESLLTMLFAVLAIAIKIRIVSDVLKLPSKVTKMSPV
jgi:hypothetical protein